MEFGTQFGLVTDKEFMESEYLEVKLSLKDKKCEDHPFKKFALGQT